MIARMNKKNKGQVEAMQTSGQSPPRLKAENGKETRHRLFGDDPNGRLYSRKRRRMMNHLRDWLWKKYKINLAPAEGKRNQAGSLRKELRSPFETAHDPFTALGDLREKSLMGILRNLNNERMTKGLEKINRSRPKPDWRSGNLESAPTPRSGVHDVIHAFMMPKNIGLSDWQAKLDAYLPKIQRTIGRENVNFTVSEVAVRAGENKLRRVLGLPTDNHTKNYKEEEREKIFSTPVPPILNSARAPHYTENAPRYHRAKDGEGNTVDYIRSSHLFKGSKCLEKYLRRLIYRLHYGIEVWDVGKQMWVDNNSVDSLVNIRMLEKKTA